MAYDCSCTIDLDHANREGDYPSRPYHWHNPLTRDIDDLLDRNGGGKLFEGMLRC